MKRMGIEARYREPNIPEPAPEHKIYPYLLRNLAITRPNPVRAMDITYIPMARGFIYLAAAACRTSNGCLGIAVMMLGLEMRCRTRSARLDRWPNEVHYTSQV